MTVHKRLTSSHNTLALTFDDGPDPSTTPKLLSLLAQHDVRATFFLIGDKVRRHPALAREILNQGHLVSNHTDSHRWALAFSNKIFREELQKTQDTFQEILGVLPRFFRPPRGVLTPWMKPVIREFGMETVLWSLMPGDYWFWHTQKSILKKLLNRVGGGDIVVLHDGLDFSDRPERSHLLHVVRLVLSQFKDVFRMITLDEGLSRSGYLSQKLPVLS